MGQDVNPTRINYKFGENAYANVQTTLASHRVGSVINSQGTLFALSGYITLLGNVLTIEIHSTTATINELYPLSLVSVETSERKYEKFKYIQK